MSDEHETSEERRERLVDAVALAADVEAYGQAEAALDALLAALEPPVAEMVRRGVERVDIGAGHPYNEVGSWYRPRGEA